MIRSIKKYALLLLVAVLSLSGSTGCRQLILENRMDCPTFVFISIDPEGYPLPQDLDVHLDIHDKLYSTTLLRDTVTAVHLTENGYYAEIGKQEFINVEGIAGFNGLMRNGEEWIIPDGEDGAPYYRFKTSATATDEQTHVKARFTKEFSRINIQFVIEGMEFPYNLIAKGNTYGLDLSTGDPLKGTYTYDVPEGRRPGSYSFIVPRQKDNSLRLELHRKDDYGSTKVGPTNDDPAERIDDIYMWDLLKKIDGFSWDMENLIDIDIEINYVYSTVTIAVDDWDSVETYEFNM